MMSARPRRVCALPSYRKSAPTGWPSATCSSYHRTAGRAYRCKHHAVVCHKRTHSLCVHFTVHSVLAWENIAIMMSSMTTPAGMHHAIKADNK